MQRAGSTLKKIFAGALRPVGDDAPLLAWPLACGSKIADKTTAVSYGDGVLTVAVPDRTWRHQLQGLDRLYLAALNQITSQPVTAIKFVVSQPPSSSR